MYQQITICGFRCLAEFKPNINCVTINLVVASKNNEVHELSSLILHGMQDLEKRTWSNNRNLMVESPQHVEMALRRLEQLVYSGVMKKNNWNSQFYFKEDYPSRSYASFLALDDIKNIDEVDIYRVFLDNCGIHEILEEQYAGYLSEAQRGDFRSLCAQYKVENAEYFKKKSIELANFWVSNIGKLGTNLDAKCDSLHALVKTSVVTKSQVELFRESVIQFALKEFNEGHVPILSTDYEPVHSLQEILVQQKLAGIAEVLPWKTEMTWNFSDMPRFHS